MATIPELLAIARKHQQDGDLIQAERLYGQVLLTDPENAEAPWLLGLVAQDLGQLDQAVAALRRAVALRPGHAERHLRLGNCLFAQERLAEAAACYRQALRIRPDSAEAHTNLGSTLQAQGKLEEATACHRQALRLNPGFVDARFNLGNAAREQGRYAEAADCYTEVLRRQADFAGAHLNLGMTLLVLGRFAEGWPHYEWRWHCGQPAPRPFPQPAWDGAPLHGRTILLHAEQGWGDTLMFVRYAARVQQAGGRVVLEGPAPLLRLLASVPGVDVLVARGTAPPDFDVHAGLLSLPGLFGTTPATLPAQVPYLAADTGLREHWRRALGPAHAFRVGIAWQGDPTYRWDRQRSVPLYHFAPLAAVDGVRLYSLQKGPGTEQLREVAGRFAVDDLGHSLDEAAGAFMDTAAIMMNLDLVIAADTAVAHLAGALGVPVWLVLPKFPHWPWMLDREESPWYPTMRLFRQRGPGDWCEVFGRVAQALRLAVSARSGVRSVTVEIPVGELIDKITILEIKDRKIADAEKLAHVRAELDALRTARDRIVPASPELARLEAEVAAVNESIWQAEDELRTCERTRDFGPRFIEVARSVYRHNDRRAALKRAINELLGSRLVEEKDYPSYPEECPTRTEQ